MQRYESFGECLRRCLAEAGMSASAAAKCVGFRSRNSIFRILSGDTTSDANLRFLSALHKALGSSWPEERWLALEEALTVERLGPDRYRASQAFRRVLHDAEPAIPEYMVHQVQPDGSRTESALSELLDRIDQAEQAEIVLTGCCDSGLLRLLAERCGKAGAEGRLTIRHYIDTAENVVTQNILECLPLVSMPWYNARLAEPGSCPPEMMAIYRLHSMHIYHRDRDGKSYGQTFIRYDRLNFVFHSWTEGASPTAGLLDRWRFQLELLKPMPRISEGPGVFVDYTVSCAELEDSCTIMSVKPDVHFNCIPTHLLEQAVLEGFEQSGMAAGPELVGLIEQLKVVHDRRFRNMMNKRKPTHLVYSLQAMERFMRTGVLSDQFFIQRAYTVEERREIIRVMLDAMRERPYFNVHFFRENAPPVRYEISYYEGKGVLMMDAYTGYDLGREHSEAVITLPAFMEECRRYFKDELLVHHVMSRGDTICALECLLVMNVQE